MWPFGGKIINLKFHWPAKSGLFQTILHVKCKSPNNEPKVNGMRRLSLDNRDEIICCSLTPVSFYSEGRLHSQTV